MPMRRPRQPLALLVSTSLTACAASNGPPLSDPGPSIESIYQRHVSDIGLTASAAARQSLAARGVGDGDEDLTGFVRDAYNELTLRFPRLPNPQLVMFVFPHLAGSEGVPIPGYATTFPLYPRDEYALPGEALRQTPRNGISP